jgi:uncharacterized protein YktB (UPF0637 family)
MEDGEEFQMLIVENLLLVWWSIVHDREISRIRANGLADNQPQLPSFCMIKDGVEKTTSGPLHFGLSLNYPKRRLKWGWD